MADGESELPGIAEWMKLSRVRCGDGETWLAEVRGAMRESFKPRTPAESAEIDRLAVLLIRAERARAEGAANAVRLIERAREAVETLRVLS